MSPITSRRAVAALALAVALGSFTPACGNRENEEVGNPGQGPQSEGATVGENRAVEEQRDEEK